MPAHPVSLGQSNCGGRSPGASSIGLGIRRRCLPTEPDAIDPLPLRLDLVTPNEERRVAFDQIKEKPLIGAAIGRPSWREVVGQEVSISVVAVSVQKKKQH